MNNHHGKAIGWFLSTILAAGGTYLESATPWLGLLATLVSMILGVVLLFNAYMEAKHKIRVDREDLENDKRRLEEQKRRFEDAVCKERRRTGECPLSTFRMNDDIGKD